MSAFLLSVRRQGRLFHLPDGVRRHVRELGPESVAERTGLGPELTSLLAVHDAVNWVAVGGLPPHHAPQAGVLPMPRHSLQVRRATPGEDAYLGWASTEYVADLGIPVVVPDPSQVLIPWFGSGAPLGSQRRGREGDPAAAGSGRAAVRRRSSRREEAGTAPAVAPSPAQAVVRPALPGPSPEPWVAWRAAIGAPVVPPVTASVTHPPGLTLGGSCLLYEGVDAFADRVLGEDLQISWGDVPPAAALAGTLQVLGETLERLQDSLDSVDRGHSTLLDLRSAVCAIVDRRDAAESLNSSVYAITREWPQSLGRSPPRW